jgi:cyclic pyranopterin phosphate synthase
MSYTIVNKMIQTEVCELVITHHCNLTCRGCTNLSPALTKYNIDPVQTSAWLSILSKHYHAKRFRITGGEPLLHPDLLAIINAVRGSGISDQVYIQTNGTYLHKMTDEFWKQIDGVHVSQYPGLELPTEQLEFFRNKAQQNNTEFRSYKFTSFTENYSELGPQDPALAQRIYDVCTVRHMYHTIERGFFYKCPRSFLIPKVLTGVLDNQIDGIKIIDSPSLGDDLVNYLESMTQLQSCHHCLGSVGNLNSHQQVLRKEWRKLQEVYTEELIDWQRLQLFEKVVAKHDDPKLKRNSLLAAARLSSNSFRKLETDDPQNKL